MADRKITDLTALAAGSQATGDLLTIVDVSESAAADKNKKITVESLFKGIPSNVGIGTSSPSAQLHLVDPVPTLQLTDSDTNGYSNILQSDKSLYISADRGASGTGALILRTNGTNERLRIDSSGNVGIGLTSPTEFVDIRKDQNAFTWAQIQNQNSSSGAYAGIQFGAHGNTWGIANGSSAANSNSLIFVTDAGGSNSEKMRIDSSGNVGVGTSTPSQKLHVSASSGDVTALVECPGHPVLRLKTTGTTDNTSVDFADGDSDTAGRLIYTHGTGLFSLYNNGSARLTVTSAGNVGIGTTSPSELLHLAGATNPAITLQDTTNNTDARIKTNNNGDLVFEADYNNEQGDSRIGFEVDGSEKVRIDSSGNVIIGTTAAATDSRLTVRAVSPALSLYATPGNESFLNMGDTDDHNIGRITYDNSNNSMRFDTNASEQMRITDVGDVLVNTTSGLANGLICVAFDTSRNGMVLKPTNSTLNQNYLLFINSAGTTTGKIEQNGTTSTNYVTSSDYRLKENIIDLDGAITRVKQLAPKRFNFIGETNRTVDGFLAHEAQTVVPEAISGTHNGVEIWKEGEELPEGVSVGDNKLDEDGNTIPDYQGIDQSKLVPLLTAALQEAIAKIETLETSNADLLARVTALEAG